MLEVCARLDYKSLSALAQSSRLFNHVTQDPLVWRRLSQRTFSPVREPPALDEWEEHFKLRIRALRELLIRGTNDFHAATIRRLFSEMTDQTVAFIATLIKDSPLSLESLLVESQGYVLANAHRILPMAEDPDVIFFLQKNRDRLSEDPRSEAHLARILLARLTGHRMNFVNVDRFLRTAHLITYDSKHYPIYTYPHLGPQQAKSQETGDAVVHWGVIECIYALIKFYRDRMEDAIPHFTRQEDDFEAEVPVISSMFDANLAGNWNGLYGYLDFPELEALDYTRPFTPDYFDGLSRLQFSREFDAADDEEDDEETLEISSDESNVSDYEAEHDHGRESTARENAQKKATGDTSAHSRRKFTANGSSMHGRFHIHGSVKRTQLISFTFDVLC